MQAITKRWPAGRVLAHRDFRLMWTGAFLSFLGSQIQQVAERDYVWHLTYDQALLARVGVLAMIPGTFLFPVIGFLIDIFDKKVVMTACMVALGLGSLWLGIAIHSGTAAYYQFAVVALVSGLFGTVEMPTRQSIVRECVPPEDIASAVPLQAMTFNLARVLGPAIGSLIFVRLGSAMCFYLNAASFLALIWAPYMIKADLKPVPRKPEPFRDLILEGILYTFRHASLRKFFIMEAATSILAVFYINQLPAYTDTVLHLSREWYGYAMCAVGVGAITGLLFIGAVSDKDSKPLLVRVAMSMVTASLIGLAFARTVWVAFPLLAVIGAGTIMQFNTTNAVFQLTAPARLKGRVLTMHFWALSGLAPLGLFVFGEVSERFGLPKALLGAGLMLAVVVVWAWTLGFEARDPAREVEPGAA